MINAKIADSVRDLLYFTKVVGNLMKILYKLILLSLMFLSTVIFAENSPLANDDAQAIQVDYAKPEITLELPSNPTTGYRWFVQSYHADFIKPVSRVYIPPTSQLVGAGGKDRWKFTLTGSAFDVPRVLTIKMIYARSWEAKGGKVMIFRVYTNKHS